MATAERDPGAPPVRWRQRPVEVRRHARRALTLVVVRVVVVTGLLVTAYVVAPLGRYPDSHVLLELVLVLGLLALVIVIQIRGVRTAEFPALRGLQAVAISVPLLLLPFAAIYYSAEHAYPGSFTEELSKLDAVYFTVTVFSTVGFGDIAPVSESMRAMAMVQMIVDLIVIGLLAKVLVGVVQERRHMLGQDGSRGTNAATEPTLPPQPTDEQAADD